MKKRQNALEKMPGREGKTVKERKRSKELARLEEKVAKVETEAVEQMQKAMKKESTVSMRKR